MIIRMIRLDLANADPPGGRSAGEIGDRAIRLEGDGAEPLI